MLARAACAERILQNARRSFLVAGGLERRMREDDSLVELGPFLDVGLHVELRAGSEEARDVVEEDVAHDETFLVPLLPPWVGEMEERAREARIGTEPREREAHVLAEDTRASGMTVLRETRVADRRPLAANLEPDEERVGGGDCALHEEAGLRARADLELDLAERTLRERAHVDVIAFGQSRAVRIGTGAPPRDVLQARRSLA